MYESHLYKQLKKDQRFSKQVDEIITSDSCQIDPSFLGFSDTYRYLAKIIDEDWTIIDLGCNNCTQAFYFLKHERYIGVDISDCLKLETPNVIFYKESIKEFIEKHKRLIEAPRTFAICNYVPCWGEERRLIQKSFKNLYIYYP